MKPRIGEPRVYPAGQLPIVFPGERARAAVRLCEAVEAAMKAGSAIELTADYVDGWTVEPAPGWRNAVRRWQWRIIGRWFDPAWRKATKP